MLYAAIVLVLLIAIGCTLYNYYKRDQRIKAEKAKAREMYDLVLLLIDKLDQVRTIKGVWLIHRMALDEGIRPFALTDEYYFRNDPDNLNMNDVYLGNIYGLWTKTADYWEQCNDTYGFDSFGISADTPIKDIILKQYKNIVLSALLSEKLRLFPKC